MYKLSEGAVQVVAQGTRETIDQLDAALEVGLRTMADAIAGLRTSGVPAGRVQHVHDTMIDSFEGFRATRKSFIKAVGHLQVIQQRSNQAETAAGCPAPWHELFTTASLQHDCTDTKEETVA
jgi:acylphosphatase